MSKTQARLDLWRQLVAKQQQSGLSVRAFCQQHRSSEHSFYQWRFDGLHALVSAVMQLDAFAGHLFVFANRRRDRIKILYWDRDGFAVWAKRLEEGTYAMPFGEEQERRREITAQELGALLSGIDLSQAKRRKRYQRKGTEAL